MLRKVTGLVPPGSGEDHSDEPVVFIAEDQTWDAATLKQLRDEYGVIFNGGIRAYMVLDSNRGAAPFIVVGYEDDGIIMFEKKRGHYVDLFSAYWLDSIIDCLTKTESYCRYKTKK